MLFQVVRLRTKKSIRAQLLATSSCCSAARSSDVFCLFMGLDWSATYSRKNSTRGTLLMAARIAAWPSHWSLRETDRVRRRTCLHEDQRIRANHAGRHSRGPRRRQSYRSLLPRRRPVQPQNGMAVVRRLSSQIGRGERGARDGSEAVHHGGGVSPH
jgi:hypothetical protein